MNMMVNWLAFVICLLLLPPINLGVVKKVKARLQNRIGAPIQQPLFNLIKLLRKGETVSQLASWLFRSSATINFSAIVLISLLVPWLSFKPLVPGDDIFLVIYMLALMRFFTILSSLDTGSPFGAFGASREATLSLLVEPAVILSLVALTIPSQISSLSTTFSFQASQSMPDLALWLLAGTGLFLSSIVELSRMPVDDPTTHLELTMVHEAMIIENSGKNLALVEYSYALRMAVLYGLSAQCYLHALNFVFPLNESAQAILSVAGILGLGIVTAIIESTAVKLQWRKAPEFIAYALTMSLLASLVAVARGAKL